MKKTKSEATDIVATEQYLFYLNEKLPKETAPLLRELMEHIDVYETEVTGKNRTQRIVIYNRFVGYIEIPDLAFSSNYTADTRQGVAVEYVPKAIPA